MQPLKLLVIDEAAQLKECESAIPLQLPGLTHSILIGDECQLPSMVQSTISDEAGFGRSLFERLSSMGHSKNLLDMQYRMHPSISFFPSSIFYSKRILDAQCVKSKSYNKCYLPGPMFGPYSYINIIDGREERDNVGRSRRNMVEVAVVLKIVQNLYKAWSISQQKLSVGVISPYNAQVAAIQERIGRKYEKLDGFSVKVKSIDGFQGGEEDVIIISTVRSNSDGSIGFVSNRQRTNVALTRARHCLWILGHERTLANSESVWEALVRDAKERQCFFNADDEKELAKAIFEVKKEFDQLGDLISGDSVLFRKAIWKVIFSDCFRKSFQKLSSVRTKTSVMNLLVRLSGGWRPKKRNVDTVCESSSHILKQFKVEGLYIICMVDIIKESNYVQVLKVWDLLLLEDVPKLVRHLDSIFETYTDNFINHCQEKCLDGNLKVPKTWATSFDIVRYKSLTNNETGVDGNAGAFDSGCYVENSKVKDCLDELLLLEEESGNFVEAANIAKQQGDLLREVDLLGKAARFKEGSILILRYVFANSLWSTGSKGWPLKCFTNKEELLTKAKLFAKNVSDSFYEYVCTESNILSHEQSSLSDLTQYLSVSEAHNSLRGEILCARKVLDGHLRSNPSKYVWEEELVFNLKDHSEEMLKKSQVSMETLFYFWNFWREKTVMIFEYLHRLESEDVKVYASYGEFCLNYLGVWTEYNNLNAIYLLLNPNAEWVRELYDRFLRRKGKLVSIDLCQFVATARSYWSLELLSVGMKVLDNLEVLYRYSLKNSTSVFCQCRSLTHMYEVAKSLSDNKFLDLRYHDAKTLQKFIKLSSEDIFGLTFSLDFRISLKENMISLRGTEVCRNLFREFMFEQISLKNKLTYGQIGRVAVMILGFGNIDDEFYNKIARRFDGNQAWKVFIDILCGNNEEAEAERLLIQKFHGALEDTYNANWMKEHDYISTDCFLYLVERYLILACQFQNGYFFTTKFSFIEWFINRESGTKASSTLVLDMKPFLRGSGDLVIQFVEQLLFNKKDTIKWLKKSYSNVKDRYPLLVLRLVSIVCLLYVNFGVCLDLLFRLLGQNYIAEQLPYEFYDALRRRWNRQYSVNVIAGAFKRIENPLILVSVRKSYSEYIGPDTIFVDMKVNHCKEDILRLLFPVSTKALQVQAEASNNFNQAKSIELPYQDMDYGKFCEIFDAFDLMENGSCPKSIVLSSPAMKVNVHKSIVFLTDAIRQVHKNHSDVESKILCGKANIMLDNLKQLDAALAASDKKPKSDSIVRQLLKSCSMRRQTMGPFFTKLFGEHDTNPPPKEAAPVTSISPFAQNVEDNNKAKESGRSDKGMMEVQKDVVDSRTQETPK